MPDQPKVSICCISYNHARFLPTTLESALAQTYHNIELVVVDDGSTDGSLDIARRYEAKYPDKMRVYTHPAHANRGISETANLAFEKSTGVLWSGLPSDDVYHADKIERQVHYFASHPDIDWVYGPVDYIDDQGSAVDGTDYGQWGRDDLSRYTHPIHRLIIRNVIPGMTALVRRSFMDRIHLRHEPNILHSDWNFWALCLSHGRVGYMSQPLVSYRVHTYNTSVGISREVDLTRSLEALDALAIVAETDSGELGRPDSRAILQLQLTFLRFCFGEVAGAKEHLARAFTIYPELLGDDHNLLFWWLERREPISREPEFVLPSNTLLQVIHGGNAADVHTVLTEYPLQENFLLWFLESVAHEQQRQFFELLCRVVLKLLAERAAHLAHARHESRRASHFAIRRFLADPDIQWARTAASYTAESWLGDGLLNRYRAWKRQLRRRALAGSDLT